MQIPVSSLNIALALVPLIYTYEPLDKFDLLPESELVC